MTRRTEPLALVVATLAGLAAGLAGCSSSSATVTAHAFSPAAAVPFFGNTTKSDRVLPFIAVAAARGDELRLVDQRDLVVVVGPDLVFPISVPTETRPLLLASARLNDDVRTNVHLNPADNSTQWDTTYRADVLVAVSGGERKLQLVDTWATTGQVFDSVDLGPLLASSSAEILSLTGMPARNTDGCPEACPTDYVPARVVVAVADAPAGNPDGALTVGKLVVVEFRRVAAATARAATGVTYPIDSVMPDEPTSANVFELGFIPSDVQLEPDFPVTAHATTLPDGTTPFTQVPDGYKAVGTRLFVSSRQQIAPGTGSGYGVAVYDTFAPGAPLLGPPAFLDALAPTLSVAAGWVDERIVDQTGTASTDKHRYCSADIFEGQPQLRVYAGLAPEGCGVDQPINCGIVTLDLGTGQLAPDPAARVVGTTPSVPAQPYRAPIPVNGLPLHISIVTPAAGYFAVSFRLHPQGWPLDFPPGDSSHDPALSSLDCNGTTAPAVPPGSGKGLNLMRLYETSGLRYTSAFGVVSSSDGRTYWLDLSRWAAPTEVDPLYGVNTRTIVNASATLQAAVTQTNGNLKVGTLLGMYTKPYGDPTSTVVNGTYTLPDAIYVWPGFTDSDTWSVTYQGYLPRLDSQSGVLLTAGGQTYLAAQSPLGDALGGGGWAVTAAVADPALGVHVGDLVGAWTRAAPAGCQLSLQDPDGLPPDSSARLSFPAKVAAVLSAADAAAVGLDAPGGAVQLSFPDPQTTACFEALKYDPSAAVNPVLFHVRAAGFVLVNGKLGYLGRPELGVPFSLAWRDESAGTPEQRALARKARRIFYPATSSPCPYQGSGSVSISGALVGCFPGFPELSDPLQPGPVISFELGLMDGSPTAQPLGGDGVIFTTQSGRIITSRVPLTGGTLPAQAFAFDWSVVEGTPQDRSNEPIRVAVPFLDDQLYFFSPSGANSYDVVVK